MRWRYVLFDLDGTLFDTSPGIMRCLYESLAECGFDGGDLRRFVGPPLLESLSEFCGMDAAQAAHCVALYRARYKESGVYECAPMAGAEECLCALKREGARLAVATSKPLRFALQILTRFRFDRYFDVVCGAESDAHSAKAEIVAEALARLGSPAPADCVMVGDRMDTDVISGMESGMSTVLVLSGVSTMDTLKTYAYRPTAVLSGVGEIVERARQTAGV